MISIFCTDKKKWKRQKIDSYTGITKYIFLNKSLTFDQLFLIYKDGLVGYGRKGLTKYVWFSEEPNRNTL